MPYNDGFVLALMHKGRPAREKKGKVYLPFDSEYSIRVKNKNFQRAIVKIYIDGTPVESDDEGFVLNGKSDIDIERFVDDYLDKGNKFKFVSLEHGEVQDPTSSENGIIEVKIYKEKQVTWWPPYTVDTNLGDNEWHFVDGPQCPESSGSLPHYPNPFTITGNYTYVRGASCNATSVSCNLNNCSSVDLEVESSGATVHGGESDQLFHKVDDFPVEDKPVVLKMKILGRKFDESHDTFCTKCGRKRGPKDKFCGGCGTKYSG